MKIAKFSCQIDWKNSFLKIIKLYKPPQPPQPPQPLPNFAAANPITAYTNAVNNNALSFVLMEIHLLDNVYEGDLRAKEDYSLQLQLVNFVL
jgi:hypothetical protein